jgi:hypothetical protein
MIVNIQVNLHTDYSHAFRVGEIDKRTAVESAVLHGHYVILETIDEGEEND